MPFQILHNDITNVNGDVISTTRKFDISEEFASNYVRYEVGTQITYEVMNSANSTCRAKGVVDISWKSRVEEDYEMRKEQFL